MVNVETLFKNAAHARTVQSYSAGQVIFQQGQTGTVMYIVIEGEVEITYQGTVLETIGPGALMGELALLDPHHIRSATATAKTACKLIPIDQTRFTFLVQETPYFALDVMKVMADRLRKRTIAKVMLALEAEVPGAADVP